MRCASPRQVVLDDVRKQADHAMLRKPVTTIPPWPLLQCLPWLLPGVECDQDVTNNSFLPGLLLVIVFIPSIESRQGQHPS